VDRHSGAADAVGAVGTASPDRAGRAFVGRRDELARIEALLDRADEQPWAATVEGPAGIGKSSLLREFGRRAAGRGCTVLTGRGSEFEQAVPFGPFLDAMDLVVGAAGGALPHDAAGPVSSGLERHRLYRRLREAVTTLSRSGPVAIVLDDLQWADEASVGLLEFLVNRPPGGPVSLLMAFRSGQSPCSPSANGSWAAPTRRTRCCAPRPGPRAAGPGRSSSSWPPWT
jgi:predicted ATPase